VLFTSTRSRTPSTVLSSKEQKYYMESKSSKDLSLKSTNNSIHSNGICRKTKGYESRSRKGRDASSKTQDCTTRDDGSVECLNSHSKWPYLKESRPKPVFKDRLQWIFKAS
jgi:hypothetical protein